MPSLQDELKKIKKTLPNKTQGNQERYIESQKRASRKKPIIQMHKKREGGAPTTIQCEYCKKPIRKSMLDAHHKEVHPEKVVKPTYIECSKCKQKIRTPFMAKHMEQNHRNDQKKIHTESNGFMGEKDILHLPFSKNIKFTLSNPEDYKNSDPWVSETKEVNTSKESIPIYIGLDFGTSYTKAVISISNDYYVVDWEGISNFSKHMLPSEFSLLENNDFRIGNAPNNKEIFSNLKVSLIEGDANNDEEEDVENYLALVLKYIRKWWYKNWMDNYKDETFEWYINVGLPAKINKNKSILNQYKHIIKSAWENSYSKESSESKNPIEINCFSEFQAQVQTYLKNPQRQKDLHLLCDIGAGTVDVVGFNINQNDKYEDVLPEFHSRVENFGTHYLLQLRLESDDKNNKSISSKEIYDASELLTSEEFSKKYKIDSKLINNADDKYVEVLSKLILQVLGTMKVNRYSTSPSWNSTLRCFLCGGAAKTNIIKAAINKVKKTHNCLKPIAFPLPKTIQTDSIDSDQFQRISVAYGLACDPHNIPKPKDEDKYWRPPKLPIRKDFGDEYDQ